jgi:hypothetical protein
MTSERQNRISTLGRIFFSYSRETLLFPSSVNIAAANYTPCSCIDRQPEKVAPAATFACNYPVTSSHIGMSDASKAISLGYSNRFRTVDAMHSSIATHAIAVNGDALCMCARNYTWRQVRKEHGAGDQNER